MKWFLIFLILFASHAIEAKERSCSKITQLGYVPVPWRLVHDEQLGKLPSTADVLLIGDSHASLWDPTLFAPRQTFNAGVGGASIEQMLWRMRDPRWRAVTPKNVILFIGSNNHARGDCAFEMIEGISTIVSRMVSLWPNARLFVVGIPPRGMRGSLRSFERDVMNMLLDNRVRSQGAIYVETDEIVQYLGVGDVHYDVGAYRTFTTAIRPLL